ncbi:MAG TPA: hypothetical protein VHE35_02245 [Kofleriaceae bacterium]|nr:hypothetical protein [Kofleriaceae bacterium]
MPLARFRTLRSFRTHALLFVVGLVVYGALAHDRLGKQSTDPHFVYQADAWLHGHAAIIPPPARGDDWAKVETVQLSDGRTVRGRRLYSRPELVTTRGEHIPTADITGSLGTTYYVSFPPFPAVLMLPSAILSGRAGNDVIPTVLVAALILPLAFGALRRLAAAGQSTRTATDDVWLTLALAFGTVLFFSSVQGRVWFTAHVVGVALCAGYAWASIEAAHPIAAGLCLGFAAVTRTPMAFMFPLFGLEAIRLHGGLARLRAEPRAALRAVARPLLAFAIPVVVIAIAAMIYNAARFDAPTEFGHTYLAVKQQAQMEAHGLFSYTYLTRNLAVAFTLLPELPGRAPWVQISGHGLALWFTTPLFVLLLWPRERPPIHRALWLTVALVAIPTFFYQNDGWVQFGYRFSLDYTVFLVLLFAAGGRPLGRLARALVVFGIAVNLFGAWSFARHNRYYRVDNGPVIAN